MQIPKRNSYNDGVMIVVSDKTKPNSFNAKTNSKKIDDFETIKTIFYSEESKRQEDMLFAESMNHKLTLKVKTTLVDGIKNSHKVIINDYVYDIIHTDINKKNHELYFYLEGVRKVER